MTLAFWLGGPGLIGLLTDIPSVREAALAFLPFAAVLPAVSVWAFVLDGLFFGATRTAELRNATMLAALVFGALAAWLPGLLGNTGLWLAFLVFMGARALFLGLCLLACGCRCRFRPRPRLTS